MHHTYIAKLESKLGMKCIEEGENEELVHTTFMKDDKIVFVEAPKVRQKNEPNYLVCTFDYEAWDGYDTFREVFKQIKKYLES